VSSFRLTARARRDLDDIYEYGYAAFGEHRADAYLTGLERLFALLADFPQMAPLTHDAKRPVRRFRVQSHIVFYREDANGIIILAVIHHARDWRRQSH
jgi:toxin ParE1/3/4